jgi:hypothetical protein
VRAALEFSERSGVSESELLCPLEEDRSQFANSMLIAKMNLVVSDLSGR